MVGPPCEVWGAIVMDAAAVMAERWIVQSGDSEIGRKRERERERVRNREGQIMLNKFGAIAFTQNSYFLFVLTINW